jgi:hypothetical protein
MNVAAVIFAPDPCPLCKRMTRACADPSATVPQALVVDFSEKFQPPPICWPCYRAGIEHDLATLREHQAIRARSYSILLRRAVAAG